MTKPKDAPVWSIAAHTAAKHDLLRSYLGAWIAIFGHSSAYRKANFIDGFAGPGIYEDGEPGSPIIALRTFLDHASVDAIGGTTFNFMFNEADPERYAILKDQIKALRKERGFPSNLNVEVANRNFHDLGEEILKDLKQNEILAPTFFFIDPFGYTDVPLDLIQRLLAFNACEMLIYFDFNSVNRFATAGVVDDHFEALFGTDEFKNAPASGAERHEYLRDLYERQLRDVGNFAHVRSFAMVPDHGHVSYYLFFCTRNLQAFDKMKAQMWKLDPTGGFRFEDRLAGQPVLFGDETAIEQLQDELARHFAGRTVDVQRVIDYTVAETPFYSGQVKRSALAPMQRAGRITCPNQTRANTYKEGTRISFPATP